MTKRDLIQLLERFDDDLPVHFAFPSGDYWRTIKTAEVDDAEQKVLHYSPYHNSYVVPRDQEDREFEMRTTAIVLK